MLGCTLYHDECSMLKYQSLLLCIILRGNKGHFIFKYAWGKLSKVFIILTWFHSSFIATLSLPYCGLRNILPQYEPYPCTSCILIVCSKQKETFKTWVINHIFIQGLLEHTFKTQMARFVQYFEPDKCKSMNFNLFHLTDLLQPL